MSAPRTIVIVGGGFGGIALAQALEKQLPAGWQLMLISEQSYTTFNPMLAEVVGAAIFPEQVIAPVRELLPRTRFVMGRVTRIDAPARRLTCESLLGPLTVDYVHLVLAFGQRANLDLLPGLAEHALPLKLVGDAMHIRNHALERLACVELAEDAALRRRLGHFVVIGGGFSGVEVAGALADFLRSARRYYPRVAAEELKVSLLHSGDRLLPELPAPLGHAAARSLQSRGVDVRLDTRAARVSDAEVTLADGNLLATATVVCTIGTRPNPLCEQLGVPLARGRIVTRADCSVSGVEGLWALGDCAAVPNALSGETSPPTAQFAVAQAAQLATNLLAQLHGARTAPFGYLSKGMMATTGHQKGVALLFGARLSGLPAWLMWRAYYLAKMPTFGRKLRIWVEWTWSMLFPVDVTYLRFTCTREVEPGGRMDFASPAAMPLAQGTTPLAAHAANAACVAPANPLTHTKRNQT